MTNYRDLDMEYKRELLVNFQSAMFAYLALEHISGGAKEDWMERIVTDANDVVDSLSDEEVERLIDRINDQHNGVTQPWVQNIMEI
jgi:hypothetical protein